MDQLEMGLKLSSNDRNRERILQERDEFFSYCFLSA